MNKLIAIGVLLAEALAFTALPAPSYADDIENLFGGEPEYRWMIRGRAIGVRPDDDSRTTVIGGGAEIDNTVVPELDFTYFFTSHVAAELIAAVTPHDVTATATSAGNLDLGDVWLLPPTLTLQYHFTPNNKFRPYVGAGVNYTHFFGEDAGTGVTAISVDDTIGGALQVGFDYMIDERWSVNFDVKKVWIEPDVKLNGGAINADLQIDPWIIGMGVGYRF